MNYAILADELNADPLGRGYATMSDAAAADSLNTANRTIQKPLIRSTDLYNSIVVAEWQALSEAQRLLIRDLFGLGEIDVRNGTNARTLLLAVFGPATTTRSNLVALVNATVSRAVELGLGPVNAGDVQTARKE